MNAPAPAIETPGREAAPPWAEFPPEVLAWLALPPQWRFDVAEQVHFSDRRTLDGLGLMLDALAQAGLLWHRSTLDPRDWEIAVGRAAASRSSPGGRPSPAALRNQAARIGLLRPEEAGEPEDAVRGEPSGEPVRLPVAEVQLRSRGLRFPDAAGRRVGDRVALTFTRAAGEPGQGTTSFAVDGTVVAARGDAWSGRSTVVMFDSVAHLRGEFPAGEIYAEFGVVPGRRKPLLEALRRLQFPLERVAVELGRRLREVMPPDARFPARTWAELAAAEGESGAFRRLAAELKAHLDSGRTAAAEQWLAAGQVLALALGGPLETGVLLGQRRLELAYRKIVDARLLESFVPRRELIAAFEEVLDDERGPWALHYLGVGGVGKTMLVRHLTATLAEQLPVSRVDFDFLSPDYPVRRPAQLLLELGDGLRGFGSERSDDLFLKLQDQVTMLHAALESAPPTGDELASLDDGRFAEVLELFSEFLRTLLQQPVRPLARPRLVLILDTCEELARLRADGEFQPAVAATFLIFERLHARVPEVRVIFAGRRLLSGRGAGWEAADAATREPAAGSGRPRPDTGYLRLQLVRGFTRAEAKELLTRRLAPKPGSGRPPMGDALVDAILAASPEIRLTVPIRAGPEPTTVQFKRHNPFQLALYAAWFLEDPELSPATITSGETDPYVEKRILGRLGHPQVFAVLPALVLLRTADEALLRRAAGLPDDLWERVFRELCQLEWIEYRSTGPAGTRLLTVERNLAPRIERCLAAGRESARGFAAARVMLGPLLRDALVEPGTNEVRATTRLAAEQIVAALRLLPAEEAARLWAAIERRVTREAAWPWARQICERLLAEEKPAVVADTGDAAPPEGPATVVPAELRAHVRATLMAALLRSDPPRVTEVGWNDVERDLAVHPDPAVRAWLGLRAQLGRVTVRARAGQAHEGRTFVDLLEGLAFGASADGPAGADAFHREQVSVALLAAIDAVLEMLESGFDEYARIMSLRELPPLAGLPAVLGSAQWIVRQRWRRVIGGNPALESPPPRIDPELLADEDAWLDWPRTPVLTTRFQLEILRELRAARAESELRTAMEEHIAWQGRGGLSLSTLDYHALTAAVYAWRLEQAGLSPPAIEAVLKEPAALHPWVSERVVHRRTPPLFVVLADAWLGLGEPDRALQLLYRGSAELKDPSATGFAEAMRLRVVRRMRLENEARELVAQKSGSHQPEEWLAAAAVLRLVDGRAPAPAPMEQAAGDRRDELAAAGWCIQELLTPEGRAGATREGPRLFAAAETEGGLPVQATAGAKIGPRAPGRGRRWFTLRRLEHQLRQRVAGENLPDARGEFLRLLDHAGIDVDDDWRLRLWVAAWREDVMDPGLLRGEAGLRAAGNWALDEGELLALRWPVAGARLLAFAGACYRAAGEADVASAFIADVRLLVARLHAHDVTAAIEGLPALRSQYEDVSRRHPELPAATEWMGRRYDDFWVNAPNEARPEMPVPSAGEFVVPPSADLPPAWRGWMNRLQHALEYCRIATKEREKLSFWAARTEAPEASLELRLLATARGEPETGDDSGALPETESEEKDAPASGGGRALLATLGRLLRTTATFVLGLGMAALVLASPFFAFYVVYRWLAGGNETPVVSGGMGWFLLVFGWIVNVAIVWALLRRLQGWCARRSEIILSPGAAESGRFPVVFDHDQPFEHPWGFLLLPFRRNRRRIIRRQGVWSAAPADGPADAGSGSGGAEVRAGFSAWAVLLRTQWNPVALIVARNLEEHPWEERLAPWYAPEPPVADARPGRPWRNYALYRWQPPAQPVPDPSVRAANTVFLVCGPRWQAAAEVAWKSSALRVEDVRDEWFELAREEWPRRVRAVHFLGRPVAGPSGAVLKIDLTREFLQTGREAPAQRRELLVTPGRRGLEEIPLLVVQAEPAAILELTESDRQETRRLRAFCHQMFTGGARAVLMIPAMHVEAARKVMDVVARRTGQARELDLRALLALSRDVREATAATQPARSVVDAIEAIPGSVPSEERVAATQLELALNVTLFARHAFHYLQPNEENPRHA